MNTRPLALVPALLLLAGALSAAVDEVTLNDFRLEGGFSPQTYKAGGTSNKVDSAWRFGVQYMRSIGDLTDRGGWFIGLEGSDTTAPGKNQAGDINTWVADLHLGYAFALPDAMRRLHFEIGAFGGLGRSTYKNSNGGQSIDKSDVYWEAGARGALVYTFESRWQLGVDLRYLHGEFKPNLGAAGSTKIKDDGLVAMLLLGYRF